MLWFGFPTGPKAEQGVRNLVLTGVHFKANDLKKGDHFMIMADHGTDWHIYDNKFTMVHKRNSHIFDLDLYKIHCLRKTNLLAMRQN